MRRRHYFQYGFLDKKKEYLVSEPVCVPYTEYSLFVNTLKLMTLPVTEHYFKNVYIDKSTKKPIELSDKLKRNLKSKANKLISLYSRKGIKLMFTDVDKILQKLNII